MQFKYIWQALLFKIGRIFAKSVHYLRHVRPSVCPSIHMYQLGSQWTDFHKIWFCALFYENLPRNSKFDLNRTKNIGQLTRTPSTSSCCRRDKSSLKAFLCNNPYFYIVDSDMKLNNTLRTSCCLSIATTVMRTLFCVPVLLCSVYLPHNGIVLFSVTCTVVTGNVNQFVSLACYSFYPLIDDQVEE
jgi:hypothetical protein